MARLPNPPPAPTKPDPALWMSYALVGVCGVCLGIIGTYFALRPQLQRATTPVQESAAPMSAAPGDAPVASSLPPAGLTTGMAPAQADRTLGNFYYDQANWGQAVRHYESAIQQGSDDADIRTDLGNAYQFSGRADTALAQYQHAQQMNPQHEFSLFNQGGLYLNALGNPGKAVEIWKQYLERFPNGRNVMAARQLIAQATGTPAAGLGTTLPASPVAQPAAPDATEARLFQLVTPAKPAPAPKP